jgi:hypothetical protein
VFLIHRVSGDIEPSFPINSGNLDSPTYVIFHCDMQSQFSYLVTIALADEK